MSYSIRGTALLAASLLLAVTTGCGDAPTPPTAETKPAAKKTAGKGKNSPTAKQAAAAKPVEELWEKFRQAVIDKQWDVVYNSLHTESRKLLLGGMLIGAHRLSTVDPARQPGFEQLLSAHALSAEKFQTPKPLLEMRPDELTPLAKELGAGVSDPAKCFNDVMTWLATNVPNAADYRFLNPDEWKRTTLQHIRMDGLKASGTLATAAEDGDAEAEVRHAIAFVFQLDWKIDLETSELIASGKARN